MDGMSDRKHSSSGLLKPEPSGFVTETPKPDPDVDNHPPNAEERELREYPLDLAAVRTKLADKQGKQCGSAASRIPARGFGIG